MSPVIFTPDNEPYIGRELLYHFDQIICSTMEQNAITAPKSRDPSLTELQRMACQVIPQSISSALSMRELIRQGYLFSAHVLRRSLVERAIILLYLHLHPEKINLWEQGWHKKDGAPDLAIMLDAIQNKWDREPKVRGRDLTNNMNSLLHAKPDSAFWNQISINEIQFGQAASKILSRPDLCDDVCADSISWLAVIQAMMNAYFPNIEKA